MGIKIKTLIASCLIGMLMLSGCAKKEDTIETRETPLSVSVDDADSDSNGYEIVKDFYRDGEDITVNYPRIEGLQDENIQGHINGILKEAAMSYFDDDPELINLDISYEIKHRGNNLLSVRYYGWAYVTGAAHPSKLDDSRNINMKTGQEIDLNDLFFMDEIMIGNIIKNSTYVGPMDLDEGEETEIVQNDLRYYLGEYGIGGRGCYFTEDSFCISVDTSHAIGGYAEFATKYGDLARSMNLENGMWNDFKEIINKSAGDDIEIGKEQSIHKVSMKDLYNFTKFEDQSFNVDLENWGAVSFVSGWDFNHKLSFYLTDDTGTILYRLPDYRENYWVNLKVLAVSFKDVDEDGLRDIIIIAQRNNAFSSCDVYLQRDKEFVQVPALYEDMNDSDLEYDTVAKVVEYMKSRGKAIADKEVKMK